MQFTFLFKKNKLVQLIILSIITLKPNQTKTSQENYKPISAMDIGQKKVLNKMQNQQHIKIIL